MRKTCGQLTPNTPREKVEASLVSTCFPGLANHTEAQHKPGLKLKLQTNYFILL